MIEGVRGDSAEFLCSVTVIRVRRRRDMLGCLRQWRWVRRELRTLTQQPLFVHRSVDVRAREVTFVSLWPSRRSLLLFNGLGSHVRAVRWVIFGRHETWTGVFGTVGLAYLSRAAGEPTWLEKLRQSPQSQAQSQAGEA
jgi:hypothetical protein